MTQRGIIVQRNKSQVCSLMRQMVWHNILHILKLNFDYSKVILFLRQELLK